MREGSREAAAKQDADLMEGTTNTERNAENSGRGRLSRIHASGRCSEICCKIRVVDRGERGH